MFDFVVRPMAGLLICAVIGAVIFFLPAIITYVRAWFDQEDPRDLRERITDGARQATRLERPRGSEQD